MNKLKEILKGLDSKKRDKIINCALDEFGRNRYDKASTNNIVKKAGISKGLLFYYFKNKKSLYEYIKFFTFETVVNEVIKELDWDEPDLLLRIRQATAIKLDIINKYPNILKFFENITKQESVSEVKKFVETIVPGVYDDIYTKNINYGLFKEGIDMERVMKIIKWTFNGMREEWRSSKKKSDLSNKEEVLKELDGYLTILKELFYK